MLRERCRVIVQSEWRGERADALIALHAFRSASSIAAFRAAAQGPIAVVLSGTDLYRDLPARPEAARSLDSADRVVALQEDAPRLLEPRWRSKCEVIYQSARALRHRPSQGPELRCIVVGHLRAEKDPLTVMRALAAVPASLPLRVRHIGAPLDAALGRAAQALARSDPRYRYLGGLPHGITRAAIASADLLLHPSAMEGGANVIVEAVTAGTSVLASRISGNVGMLGAGYPGYFEAGDANGLATLLCRCGGDPRFLRRLAAQCRARKPLFDPRAETRAVRALAAKLFA